MTYVGPTPLAAINDRGRIDLATSVRGFVDPVKVQVRLVRGKLRLQLLRQCGVFLQPPGAVRLVDVRAPVAALGGGRLAEKAAL